VTDRRLAVHAANPNCGICEERVLAPTHAFIKGEEVQRLVHPRCFVREICRTNPTFNQRRARQRAEASRERLVS
jgi:hypothetical protein